MSDSSSSYWFDKYLATTGVFFCFVFFLERIQGVFILLSHIHEFKDAQTESSTASMKNKYINLNVTVSSVIHEKKTTKQNKNETKQRNRAIMRTLCIATKGNDMFLFFIGRYDATPNLRAVYPNPYPFFFTLQILVPSVTVFPCHLVHCHCLRCPSIYSGALSAN